MDPNTLFHQGKKHHKQGDLDQAEALYTKILAAYPDHPQVLHGLGMVAFHREEYAQATTLIEQALAVNPVFPSFHNNLGNCFKEMDDPKLAEVCYRQAIDLNPKYAAAHLNLGLLLIQQSKSGEGERHIRQAVQLKPDFAEARCELGRIHARCGEKDKARRCYEETVRQNPHAAVGHLALAGEFQRSGAYEQAIACYRQGLQRDPRNVDALIALGCLLSHFDRLAEAEPCFVRALEVQSDHIQAFYQLMDVRARTCNWATRAEDLQTMERLTEAYLEKGGPVDPTPRILHYFPLPDEMHARLVRFQAGRIQARCADINARLDIQHPLNNPERLKIGYVSPDFGDHAVGLLIHDMFRHHDRTDIVQKHIRGGVDHFIDIAPMTAEESAKRIHEDGIHILIDLAGLTAHCRPDLFALEPAPVQAHYLGYPNTIGADWLPYIIADEIVIPEEHLARYAESVVFMPDTFAVTSPLTIDPAPITRREAGLPEDAFVFCGFNSSYKIEPEVFAAWMRILEQTPGSMLWLTGSNESAEARLKNAAEEHGIDPARLTFAERTTMARHLARVRLADLYLDTFIYNGGSTTVCLLTAGLPTVTRSGDRYHARMAASMVRAAGLPDLICGTTDAYITRAVHFATHPDELAEIRQRLADNQSTAPLFQTARFVRHLEQAYQQMWGQYMAGKKGHIQIRREDQ